MTTNASRFFRLPQKNLNFQLVNCNAGFLSTSLLFSEWWSLEIYSEVETLDPQLDDPQPLELETKSNSSTAPSIEPTIGRKIKCNWKGMTMIF